MSIAFELAGEADGEVLVRLARAFHLEDGHPLDNPGEAALLQITRGEPFARSGLCGRMTNQSAISYSRSATASNMAAAMGSSMNFISCPPPADEAWAGHCHINAFTA